MALQNCRIFASIDLLQQAVAEDIYSAIKNGIAKKGYFTLVLSGGKTPVGVFRHIRKFFISGINWSQVYVFWVDERAVPHDDINSNFGNAYQELFYAIPDCNLFPMNGDQPSEQSAREYEFLLRNKKLLSSENIPRFDYLLLGLGKDGHIASLFTESDDRPERFVISTVSPDGVIRITMTSTLINLAKRKILMSTGQRKGEIINAFLQKK